MCTPLADLSRTSCPAAQAAFGRDLSLPCWPRAAHDRAVLTIVLGWQKMSAESGSAQPLLSTVVFNGKQKKTHGMQNKIKDVEISTRVLFYDGFPTV